MKTKVIAFIASLLLKFFRLTYRYELKFQDEDNENLFHKYTNTPKPDLESSYLLAFFHQDEFCLIPYFAYQGFSVLVSKSKDGEIMAQAAGHLGYIPVRGSSSRGAVAGLIAAIRKVKEGYNSSFAVDGPRGPIYKVKEGVCALNRKTGRPILPVRAHCSNAKIFDKAWNKSKLPKPFSKVTLSFAPFGDYTSQELEEVLLKL